MVNANCQSSNLIYVITCKDCSAHYVEQTKNRLITIDSRVIILTFKIKMAKVVPQGLNLMDSYLHVKLTRDARQKYF